MKYFIYLTFCVIISSSVFAQNSDSNYKLPLKDVLSEVEKRFDIKIKYNDNQVAGKFLEYANWRFRQDVDETLKNILAPLDLKVNKEGDKTYKLKEYEYYRWEIKDGWDFLDGLSKKYNNKASWELRKETLRPQLFAALKLSPLPVKPASKIILVNKRIFQDYAVENFALEILPGLYINGSIYKPTKFKGKIPVVLSPDGHWADHRFRADNQIRCAMTAKMGAIAISYDLFGWGESLLQFKAEDHRKSLAQTVQILGAIRILDYALSLKESDIKRVGICGGSGGGSQAVLMSALDPRINLSIPVVSLSSYFFGGCPCESGMPIHQCGNGTNNVEIAAMTAPNPQLLISDGKDWTAQMPEHDFKYLQRIYSFYQKEQNVENVHLPNDGHDFGYSKRKPVYDFLSKHFNLNTSSLKDKDGNYDESKCKIENKEELYAFGKNGENLPKNAIIGFENLEKLFN